MASPNNNLAQVLDFEEVGSGRHENLRFWLRLLTCTTLIETKIRGRLEQQYSVTLPQFDLMAQLARTRYVVALSPLEGFGLFPLEAMASGCAVVGFHGGGGLDYMTEQNSRVVPYPRLDEVVDQLAAVVRDQALAQALAAQGRVDARQFTRERFEAAWIDHLRSFLAR